MKYGLFSDVHANAEAFQAVLEALEQEGVDRYVFIGDIVGYGPEPVKCVRMLKDLAAKRGCMCVAGNHDYAVASLSRDDRYTRYAREAVEWTRKQMGQAEIDFLAGLKLVGQDSGFMFVHATLEAPDKWAYIFDIDDAYPNFKLMGEMRICFIGHSHKPIIFTAAANVDWSRQDKVAIRQDTRYIINIGSVGQPRDGNPLAAYAIYDDSAGLVEIKRIKYDIASVQQKIAAAGLPVWLAQRLALGK